MSLFENIRNGNEPANIIYQDKFMFKGVIVYVSS